METNLKLYDPQPDLTQAEIHRVHENLKDFLDPEALHEQRCDRHMLKIALRNLSREIHNVLVHLRED